MLQISASELIVGSSTIGKFLAGKFGKFIQRFTSFVCLGFYGRTQEEQKKIDEIVEDVEKLNSHLTPIIRAALAKNHTMRVS